LLNQLLNLFPLITSAYLLPSTLEDDLQKMPSSFWWGSKNPQKERNKLAKLGQNVNEEGTWRNQVQTVLHAFNLAMIGKQG